MLAGDRPDIPALNYVEVGRDLEIGRRPSKGLHILKTLIARDQESGQRPME